MDLYEHYKDEKNRDGIWLISIESPEHKHGNGTYGTDIDMFRVAYKKGVGEVHRKKAKDWPKEHLVK